MLEKINQIQIKWAKNFRIGMITQKDVGEANYFDYSNGYAEYNKNKD